MIYTDMATERLVRLDARSRPSPLGRWLKAAWLHLVPAPAKASASRDRAREAAALRTWATQVRHAEPCFADDLFAAADRHEALGS